MENKSFWLEISWTNTFLQEFQKGNKFDLKINKTIGCKLKQNNLIVLKLISTEIILIVFGVLCTNKKQILLTGNEFIDQTFARNSTGK